MWLRQLTRPMPQTLQTGFLRLPILRSQNCSSTAAVGAAPPCAALFHCSELLTAPCCLFAAHSVGRAWPYRMVARTFPDSDGILFLADDAWRRRHSAFTPLFTGSNVRRYTAAMLRAAVSVAHRNALACAAHPTEPTRPVSGAAHGIGDGTAYDVLAAVRCISARVLCEWGLGVDSDSREAGALADTLDAYARTVLEVIPGAPPPRTLLIGTLRAYARTFSQRATLRRQVGRFI